MSDIVDELRTVVLRLSLWASIEFVEGQLNSTRLSAQASGPILVAGAAPDGADILQ
jgi:hypothetical protein